MDGGSAKPIRLYLSASVVNAPFNLQLREHLPDHRFELVLPQEFTPNELDHPRFPRGIYERCLVEMERCDAGLLLLDAFGVDCASEAGWFCARGKPFIGIARTSCRFLQHWMVKGNLTGIVVLDRILEPAIASDPILRDTPRRAIDGPALLGTAIEQLLVAERRAKIGA